MGSGTFFYLLDGVNTDSGSRPKEIIFPNKELFETRFNYSVLYEALSVSVTSQAYVLTVTLVHDIHKYNYEEHDK